MNTVFDALGIAVAASDPYVVVWNGMFTEYVPDADAAIQSGREWVERATRPALA